MRTKQSVSEVRVLMLEKFPFFGHLALSFPILFRNDVRTAEIDNIAIYFGNDFWDSLTRKERAIVLAHEILHEALQHTNRQEWRDNERWSIATDAIINEIILAEGLPIPAEGITFRWLRETVGVDLPPAKKLSAESIYVLLPERIESPTLAKGRGKSGGASKDQQDPGGSSSDGEGERSEEGEPGGGGSMLQNPQSPKPSILDHVFVNRGKPVTPEESRATMRDAALYSRDRQHGMMPGWMERLLGVAKAEVTWEAYLSQFVGTQVSDFRSFRRPSRRHLWRGAIFPSRLYEIELAVVIDVSGSVDQLRYNRFSANILSLRKELDRPFRLLAHDVAVTLDTLLTSMAMPKIHGGGGTDFRPVFEHFKKTHIPSAVVWLTDGWGPLPKDPPDMEILWLLTSDGTPPPFGEHVFLRPDERVY